jgi:tRNA threonylcarbamoyladenosine biosynthesis protein TsaE
MDTIAIVTSTAQATRAAGAALARLLRPRDVIVLTGDLGAGKTTFTQGVAGGLGASEHVTSPTFTLVREYVSGRLPVAHVDVYRLTRAQDVVDLALAESDAGEAGVTLIEWGDPVGDLLASERLRVELTADPVVEDRTIAVTWTGPSWEQRADALRAALTHLGERP